MHLLVQIRLITPARDGLEPLLGACKVREVVVQASGISFYFIPGPPGDFL
jgi:hypothetical protein